MDIMQFLPKGKFWEGKNLRKLLLAFQDSIMRARNDADLILTESNPQTANQLLPDWEKVCAAKNKQEVLNTLAALGGNTEPFFLEIAKRFDDGAMIRHDNPDENFIVGKSKVGMPLGHESIPDFTVIFDLTVLVRQYDMERILDNLKPAHVTFIYDYNNIKPTNFIVGSSTIGEAL